jgi:23S rRNA (cytidine1920-2'-O)/16S rRNA (cytidine1409-2'-O)-methyltransferase
MSRRRPAARARGPDADVARRRLDEELVRRGLALDRDEAAEAVRSGDVRIAGAPASSAGSLVARDQPLTRAGAARPYVSRGGQKLAAALDRFQIDAAGRRALDAGASTGGFTDCLLRRGAVGVIAVDVGYGDLAWSLRTDPRVHVFERTNVRDLSPASLPFAPDLVVADLSFTSLRGVLPVLSRVAAPFSEFVLLVKPQFEAARRDVQRGGVVRDPAAWRRALRGVLDACVVARIEPRAVRTSPLLGPAGNVEFLLAARSTPDEHEGRARTETTVGVAAEVDAESAIAEGVRLRERA